jgi:hypothetical protein
VPCRHWKLLPPCSLASPRTSSQPSRQSRSLVGDFRNRIRSVEKDLWKEYQTLESNLDVRTKRLDRLETMARSGIPAFNGDAKAELARLRDANRLLKTEVSSLASSERCQSKASMTDPSPSPSVPTGPRDTRSDKSRTSTLTRHQSASAVETFERMSKSRAGTSALAEARRACSGLVVWVAKTTSLI